MYIIIFKHIFDATPPVFSLGRIIIEIHKIKLNSERPFFEMPKNNKVEIVNILIFIKLGKYILNYLSKVTSSENSKLTSSKKTTSAYTYKHSRI